MTESIESNFISMRPAVEFVDILDQYSYNNNLECKFMFSDYIPQEGDRIAIFKLGWSFVKDYIVFEWGPVRTAERLHTVTFNKHILPKNTTEIYQICYISGENQLQGASSPFQFSSEENSLTSLSLDSGMLNIRTPIMSLESITKSQIDSRQKDIEISKLKEENAMLRESLKAVIAQKNAHSETKTYGQEIEELKTVTENLRISMVKQENEISILKKKIQDGGEEYKKLYLEKIKVEKKYDKLKGKKEESKPNNEEVWLNFEMGEFKSIPPFPYARSN